MLTRLELSNFKCFANLELDFAPITLLCGLNGMGKSSAMQALLVLRQSYEQRVLREGTRIGRTIHRYRDRQGRAV